MLTLVICSLLAGTAVADTVPIRLPGSTYESALSAGPGYSEFGLIYQHYQNSDHIGLRGETYLRMPPSLRSIEISILTGYEHVSNGDSDRGLTDLDIAVRYAPGDNSNLMSGLLVSFPTGMEAAGYGGTDIEIFGSARYGLYRVSMEGFAGVRLNGDLKLGETTRIDERTGEERKVTIDRDGKPSARIGAGLLISMSQTTTVTGHISAETARWDGSESDIHFTAGVDYRITPSLGFRSGIGFGLSDDAPDFELSAGVSLDWGRSPDIEEPENDTPVKESPPPAEEEGTII